jgi:hypothetical protein
MVIDKLWLRIKGELLTLKDDLSEGENLRARAERLLDKLEEQFKPAPTEPEASVEANANRELHSPEAPVAVGKTAQRSIQELEEEWRELVRLRNETKAKPSPSEPPSPNPRKLG